MITLKINFLYIFIKSLITNIRYYRSAKFPSYPSCCIALYRCSHTQNNLSHICSSHFHLLSRFLSQLSQHSITPQLSSVPLPSFLKEKKKRQGLSFIWSTTNPTKHQSLRFFLTIFPFNSINGDHLKVHPSSATVKKKERDELKRILPSHSILL